MKMARMSSGLADISQFTKKAWNRSSKGFVIRAYIASQISAKLQNSTGFSTVHMQQKTYGILQYEETEDVQKVSELNCFPLALSAW